MTCEIESDKIVPMIERIQSPDFKYILADFETTCLNLNSVKPWQLAFLVCEGGKVIEEKQFYIKWDSLRLSDGAKQVTRFDEKKYKEEAKENEVVLDIFERYIYDKNYFIIGHNYLFYDSYVHDSWRRYLGKKTDYSYVDRIIDTNSVTKGIKLDIPYRRGDSWLGWQYQVGSVLKKGLKSSLTTVAKENKIDWNFDTLHEALSDIRLNNIIWNKYCKPKLENWLLLT